MAMDFLDNFSLYGTNTALLTNGPYAEVQAAALVVDPDPNAINSTVIRLRPTGLLATQQGLLRRVFGAAAATAGAGFRVWMDALPVNTDRRPVLFSFRDNVNGALVTGYVNPSGQIVVVRGEASGGVQLGITPAPVLVANAWQHVEVKVLFSATVGTVEVRVEGTQVLALTNQNTSAGPAQQIQWRNEAGGSGSPAIADFYVKDIALWNGLGTRNNDFRGGLIIATIVPDGDTALNWTPTGAANGWSILDNGPPNDANFIAAGASPIPGAYQCTLTNLPSDVTSVSAVMAVSRTRKIDGGDGNTQVTAVSGVSTAAGLNRPISAAFTYWTDMFEEDPATAAPWTPPAVNAMQLRLNRTV